MFLPWGMSPDGKRADGNRAALCRLYFQAEAAADRLFAAKVIEFNTAWVASRRW